MKRNTETQSSTHGDFIASVCHCLAQPELQDWLPEGVIHYRDVCFFVMPDQSTDAPRLSIVIDLGEISPNKRHDAYRHMATYNLAKGAPDHGVLGLNFLSPDGAMHRLSLSKTDDLRPDEFARSLHSLASHALNFRASYGKKSSRSNSSLSRILSQDAADKGTQHAR